MELRSYYDFALDDWCFLSELQRTGIQANSIGSIAQNTCERFLKHLIDRYIPVDGENREQMTEVLSTHNLNRLVKFWNSYSENRIPQSVANQLRKINGFYFSTKYPGDDCQTLSREDIQMCFEVTDLCKKTVDEIISKQSLS
ncbi:MAG: hypothetical protein K5634_07785 [Sphaerochaetaceae bacterium]|nr:hypothetical protein [Sphaerochaetaceae bacterium]